MMIHLLYRLIAAISKLLLILLLIMAIALAYFGATPMGRQQLASMISHFASTPEQSIELSPIRGLLTGDIRIDRVRLIDNHRDQAWLAIDDAALRWQPLALFRSTLKVEELRAEVIEVRAPPPAGPAKSESVSFTLPELPLSVYVKSWTLPHIELSESIAGELTTLASEGQFHYAKNTRDIFLDAMAERTDQLPGNLQAKIRYQPDGQSLQANLIAFEPEGGVIAHWLNKPRDTNTTLTLQGDGILPDWEGRFGVYLNAQPYAELTIHQQSVSNHQLAIQVNGSAQIAELMDGLLPAQSNLSALLSGHTDIDIVSHLALTDSQVILHTVTLTNDQWVADLERATLSAESIDVEELIFQSTRMPLVIEYMDNDAHIRSFNGTLGWSAGQLDAVGALSMASLRTGDVVAKEVIVNASTEDFDTNQLDGKIAYKMTMSKLDIPDVTLPPIGQKPFTLTGNAQIDAGVIHLNEQLLVIDDNRIAVDATIDPKSLRFDAALKARLHTADLLDNPPASDKIEQLALHANLDGDLNAGPTITINTLSVTADGLAINGTAEAIGGAVTASLSAVVPEIAQFVPQAAGSLKANIIASGDIDDLQAQLALDSPALEINNQTVSGVTGRATLALVDYQPYSSLTLTGDYQDQTLRFHTKIEQAEGQLIARMITATVGDNRITGGMQLSPNGTPIGDFSVDLPKLDQLGKLAGVDLAGDLSGEISLREPPTGTTTSTREAIAANTASATSTTSYPQLSAVPLPQLVSTLSATQISMPQTQIEGFTGHIRVNDWQLNPSLALNAQAREIRAAGQTLEDASIEAKGKLDNIKLSARIEHHGDPLALAGQLIHTDGQRVFAIDRFGGTYQGVPIDLAPGTTIQLTPELILPPISLALADGEVTTRGSLGESSDMTITFRDVQLERFGRFLPPGTALNGTASGQVHITGNSSNPDVAINLTTDQLSAAALGEQGIDPLQATIRAQLSDGILSLSSIKASNNQSAALNASGDIDLHQQSLDLSVDGHIPLAIAQPLLARQQLSGSGALMVDLHIGGKFAQPIIDGTVAGQALSLTDQRTGISATDITLNLGFSGDQLRIHQLASPLSSGGNIQASGTVGLANQRLNLSVNGALPIGIADQQLAKQKLSGDGQVLVDLTISGTANNPDISGTVRSDQLALTDNRSGTQAKNIDLLINFTRNRAVIERATAQLSSGGQVSAAGFIGIDPAQGFPVDANIRLERAALTDGEVFDTIVDASISLTGAIQRLLSIGGTVEIREAQIRIPSNLPANLALLDVKHINAPADILAQDAQLSKPSAQSVDSTVQLDLTINAPNQIFVRGRGIDAELGGNLTLQGPANNPQTIGGFKIRRGRLNFLEKRLDFTNGDLTFAGSLTPMLDFTAVRQAADYLITIRITGLATDPEFRFSSTPDLPQSELIAMLLFERSYTDLSPLQLLQLARATAQLTGTTLGPSLTGQMQQAIGVDDVDIKTDPKTGEASVEVGKYLNDRTYVTVEQGASPEKNKATIDLDIGRGLELRGEANQAGEGKIGIFYEKEY